MKVVIFAGGFGTRLAEETSVIPKPMVRIGRFPILEHIMEYYCKHGHSDFIILTGYKCDVINDYFAKKCEKKINLNIDNKNIRLDHEYEWNVSLINTGVDSSTSKRLFQIKDQIQETFFLTYGDGLSDVNINQLLRFHKKNRGIATVTAVHPPARFGQLQIDSIKSKVVKFNEKGKGENDFINGGYFVVEKEIFRYFDNLEISFEENILTKLARSHEFYAFKHYGFWYPMDTLREKNELNSLYENNRAPWINKDFERYGEI
jgi:glucose-1-phosphate cytidylyltransferase